MELIPGSHTYFFDHTRTWRASPDEGSTQYRGQLRDSTNMKDDTLLAHTHSLQQGEHEMMVLAAKWYSGTLWAFVFQVRENHEKKTSHRKSVPTGDRTRFLCVTGAHATGCSTVVDYLKVIYCKCELKDKHLKISNVMMLYSMEKNNSEAETGKMW